MEIKTYVAGIRRASRFIRRRASWAKPQVGIILGSGLAGAVPNLENPVVIPYAEIPGFPRPTVAGHAGRLILGTYAGKQTAVLQGRFHYYEGRSMEDIALPARVLEYLGLKTIIVTAAVGSMKEKMRPGHLMVVNDHINLMGRNPLRGFHEEEFGDMFPDLTDAYDPKLRKLALSFCRKRRIITHEGVYVAVGGPSYETAAEIRAFQILGGDAVGMSVVPEVIVARQMGIRVLALAWISNMANGMKGAALSHPDVLDLGQKVSGGLRLVLQDIVAAL
ncbi:MAG: purine-nucleoside phosphorylase [Elusimicrobiota bacterium]